MKKHASPLRLQLRLGPRSLHLRARILPLEPVVLPEDAGARPGLPQEGAGQLVPRSAPPCWPTSRWWMAAAGVTKTRPSSSARSSSGSCRITAYADELLDDMAQLEGGWPERVLTMQRNWIGRSEGAEVDFHLDGSGQPIRVFTTRVDTIYGATCVILAPSIRSNETLLDCRAQARAKAMVDARADQRSRRCREGRLLHRPLRHQSVQRREGPHLGRQLRPDGLRHRRHHGRARARRARLRILPQVRHRRAAGDPPRGWRAGRCEPTMTGRRSPTTASSKTPGQWTGLAERRGAPENEPRTPSAKASARRPSPSASRTGASRASATGARRSP